MPNLLTQIFGKWCSNWSNMNNLSAHMKYVESIVITIYIPIIGNDVIPWRIDVKKLLTHLVIKSKKLFVEVCIIDITWLGISILSKFILPIYFCIWLKCSVNIFWGFEVS